MYFKKLEIFGFKSFPDKIKIIFEPGITAIVGPNGCGKTNIADAIRWVLGEQSLRMLRGNRMEDVIFAGTQTRKPLGFAEAFLTLDNTQGIFPIEFTELTVGRRLYRSGESEYYINRTPCRLKDVEELFLDTGLGRKAYSLINQDKMDLILSSSPEERRILFEEAAGIMKYKVRKEEALRKLERTEENLIRLKDIIAEIERQLNSVSRHFQKAQRYKKYKEELDALEINLGKNQWFEWQSVLKKKTEENIQVKKKKEELSKKVSQEEAKLEALRQTLMDIDSQLSKWQTQNVVKKKESESAEDKVKLYEHYLGEIEEDEKNKAIQLEFLDQKEKEREKELSKAHQALDELALKEEKKEKELLEFERKFSQKFQKAESLKKYLEKIKHEIFELVRASSLIKNKLGELETGFHKDLEDFLFSHYQRKIQLYSEFKLKEAEFERLKQDLATQDYFLKIQGKVGQMFKVAPRYKLAIGIALAPYAQVLVVEDFSSAKENLAIIKEKKIERKRFIIFEKVPENLNLEIPDSISVNEEILGKAVDFIDCEAKWRPLFNYLLGKVLVVRDIDVAEKIFYTLPFPWQIVTLTGELIEIPGFVSGGALIETLETATKEAELKNLEEVLNSLKKDLKVIEDGEEEQKFEISKKVENERKKFLVELEEKEKNIKNLEAELKHQELKYEEKIREIEKEREEMVNLKIELKTIKEKRASYSFMVSHLKETSKESSSSINNWVKDLENRKERKERFMDDIKELKKRIELFQEDIARSDQEIIRLQGEKEKLIDKIKESESLIKETKKEEEFFQEAAHQLDVELATLDTEANNLLNKLRETYGFSLNEEEVWEPLKGKDDLENRIEFLKERLETMGPVNLVAIDEHQELEERFHFLKGQSEDLTKSKESLLKVIQEVNQTTHSLFMETLNQIQKHFFEIFCSLFGGGNAKLILQDEENVLESGMEIVASPPGKKLQNINLLSGGERALVAIALLFALFEVKPSPFCVLDEIDAALDEANIHRFVTLLKKFSEKSQFIVITHNKETIASSDIIYGITMEEAGVSKIVSVKLTQGKPDPTYIPEAIPSA